MVEEIFLNLCKKGDLKRFTKEPLGLKKTQTRWDNLILLPIRRVSQGETQSKVKGSVEKFFLITFKNVYKKINLSLE